MDFWNSVMLLPYLVGYCIIAEFSTNNDKLLKRKSGVICTWLVCRKLESLESL